MGSAMLQDGRFADAQKSSFQAAKHSNMSSTIQQEDRFADTQDRVLRLGNVHICVVPPCYVVDLMILRILVFRLRKVQIWVVLSWKVVVLLIFMNSVFKLQIVQIWSV